MRVRARANEKGLKWAQIILLQLAHQSSDNKRPVTVNWNCRIINFRSFFLGKMVSGRLNTPTTFYCGEVHEHFVRARLDKTFFGRLRILSNVRYLNSAIKMNNVYNMNF